MKIGYLTACLSDLTLDEHLALASEEGFESLEVAAWPKDNGPCHIDCGREDDGYYTEVLDKFKAANVEIASLTYCPNPLSPDQAKATMALEHISKMLTAARKLGVAQITTFAGRDPYKTIDENLVLFREAFTPLVAKATDVGVRLTIENCPMESHPTGTNMAYSPEIWRRMFDIFPEMSLGLTFDPSHLFWLGIDTVSPIFEFGDRIAHVHAKDTEILHDRLEDVSIFGEGWWRYRMPGLGEIDWADVMTALAENGFTGTLAIEHEDPVWEGDPEKVRSGLRIARRHLAQYLP